MHPVITSSEVTLANCDPEESVIEEARRINPNVDYVANDGKDLPFEWAVDPLWTLRRLGKRFLCRNGGFVCRSA